MSVSLQSPSPSIAKSSTVNYWSDYGRCALLYLVGMLVSVLLVFMVCMIIYCIRWKSRKEKIVRMLALAVALRRYKMVTQEMVSEEFNMVTKQKELELKKLKSQLGINYKQKAKKPESDEQQPLLEVNESTNCTIGGTIQDRNTLELDKSGLPISMRSKKKVPLNVKDENVGEDTSKNLSKTQKTPLPPSSDELFSKEVISDDLM